MQVFGDTNQEDAVVEREEEIHDEMGGQMEVEVDAEEGEGVDSNLI